jgi:hypothetical protein
MSALNETSTKKLLCFRVPILESLYDGSAKCIALRSVEPHSGVSAESSPHMDEGTRQKKE